MFNGSVGNSEQRTPRSRSQGQAPRASPASPSGAGWLGQGRPGGGTWAGYSAFFWFVISLKAPRSCQDSKKWQGQNLRDSRDCKDLQRMKRETMGVHNWGVRVFCSATITRIQHGNISIPPRSKCCAHLKSRSIPCPSPRLIWTSIHYVIVCVLRAFLLGSQLWSASGTSMHALGVKWSQTGTKKQEPTLEKGTLIRGLLIPTNNLPRQRQYNRKSQSTQTNSAPGAMINTQQTEEPKSFRLEP